MTETEYKFTYRKNIIVDIGICIRLITRVLDEVNLLDDKINAIDNKINALVIKFSKKREYFSVGEVALIEGVCERTIRKRIKEGSIKAIKNPGERSYKIPANKYYETQTELKSKNYTRN